jgi:hypothetical protein
MKWQYKPLTFTLDAIICLVHNLCDSWQLERFVGETDSLSVPCASGRWWTAVILQTARNVNTRADQSRFSSAGTARTHSLLSLPTCYSINIYFAMLHAARMRVLRCWFVILFTVVQKQNIFPESNIPFAYKQSRFLRVLKFRCNIIHAIFLIQSFSYT